MIAEAFEQEFETRLGTGRLQHDVPMSAYCTFKCGGPAQFFFEPRSVGEVQDALELAREAQLPCHVIGCGSNLLVSDAGLPGIIVHLGAEFAGIEVQGTAVRAQAGATNRQVADAAHAAGLTGYEFASGIPGSIGGAAFMNAGAYDGEFKDVAVCVTCLTPEGELVEIPADEADWSYRHSMMQERGYVVLSATLKLQEGDQDQIAAVMADLQQRRESKQPLELGSAGSTFKRPEGYFAGKLIQDAGMRGHRVGGAMVSEKHAGFVVNAGGATAADVLACIRDVQAAVLEQFGVQLEPEVRLWGFA